jgi:RNA methyltransferase, TrmH family
VPERYTDTYQQLGKIHLGELSKLKQKKSRKLHQKVLVEGVKLIEQLIHNRILPEEMIATDPNLALQVLHGHKCKIYTAPTHELLKLTETENPQGVVGVFETPEFTIGEFKTLLYLDGIQDPGNLGTIFRTAAAFGLDAIALSFDCCEVFSPKVIRASLGSVFWLPSFEADHNWLAGQSAAKLGLTMSGKNDLKEIAPIRNQQIIIIIGSETQGISEEVLGMLNLDIRITISDKMESLNASVAAAIAMYELSGRFCS